MHEITIAKNIVEQANSYGNVKKLVLEVGDIAILTPDELKQALFNLIDWEVEIIKKPAKIKCSCGYEGEPIIVERAHELVIFKCPACRDVPEVLEGDNILLKEVEVV